MSRLVWVMLMMVVVVVTAQTDYCSISSQHTMCRYQGVAAECSHYTERRDITSPLLVTN